MIARVTYNTSGSAGPYSLTFPYLQKTDVKVYLDGTLTTLFTWPTTTTILLNSAPSAVSIEIRRSTQVASYVTFTDPSSLRKDDLNTAELQALYIAQEAQDTAAVVDAKALELDLANVYWDAKSKQIKNVTNPTSAQDAATKGYADGLVVAQGNVPAPVNPTDNGKVLKANAGAFSWQGGSIVSTDISDSTAAGRAILVAANAAAQLAAIGAAAASHVHAGVDISSGTIAQARLGSGSGGAGNKFLADDQTYKTVVSGTQPTISLTPESAAFPASNFPELKKQLGTNWVVYTLGFDTTVEEAAYWKVKLPSTAVFTVATIKIASRQLFVTTGNVAWKITTITRADAEAFDTAGATDSIAAATVKGTAGQLLMQTQALTVTGWAAGEELYIKIARDVANDTAAEDVEFESAVIELS